MLLVASKFRAFPFSRFVVSSIIPATLNASYIRTKRRTPARESACRGLTAAAAASLLLPTSLLCCSTLSVSWCTAVEGSLVVRTLLVYAFLALFLPPKHTAHIRDIFPLFAPSHFPPLPLPPAVVRLGGLCSAPLNPDRMRSAGTANSKRKSDLLAGCERFSSRFWFWDWGKKQTTRWRTLHLPPLPRR